jgi:rsbT co-antagonist protein RsbR
VKAIELIEELITKKKGKILNKWMDSQKFSPEHHEYLINDQDLRVQSSKFLDEFIKVFKNFDIEDITSPEFQNAVQPIRDLSMSRASRGFSPTETASYLFDLKNAILFVLDDDLENHSDEVYPQLIELFRFLDKLVVISFEEYTQKHEEIIKEQSEALLELSSPIISLWDNILAVPLIGTLDSKRTQMVMEILLKTIVETKSKIAIIDITGVGVVDSQVANNLIKTVMSVRLLGAEALITGIRPEVAQTIVNLGVDLKNIITRSTLAEGLVYAFRELDINVLQGS